jgi:glycosyltransferase involved in cell wall biosynthesis
MRILHVGKFFPPYRGGMETFLADLVAAQRAQGQEAFVLVHGEPLAGDPPWLRRVPVQATVAYAPIAVGFRAALDRAIADFAPDVLHMHMPNNAVFWGLTLRRAREIPWVVHWHSDVITARMSARVGLGYRLYRPFEHSVLSRAERVFVTSPPYLAASETLARWRDKSAVLPLGLGPPAAPGGAGTREFSWEPGRLRLLAIGRLAYYKGFETLVRAASALPQVQLVIGGDGELRAELEALARAAPPGAVTLLGEVSDAEKEPLLASCDLFCLASRERTEAFGMVLLEAMRHGKPCLVSDLAGSGMPWVVRESGCGWVAPPDDVPAWQAAIARIAGEPAERKRRGAAGRRALEERFTAGACARTLSTHYRSLSDGPEVTPATRGILIVIPARNEVRTIASVVRAAQAAGWPDILVVDDHSDDGTGDAARAAGARVIRPTLPLGAWGAMQTGIRLALHQGHAGVITMDADGQHEVAEIPRLMEASAGFDLVIGAFPERASRARRIAWHWFIRLTGLELEDLTSGFRYYSRRALEILSSEEATLLDYQDVGTLLMLRAAGAPMREVDVTMNLRTVGKSRIFNSWLSVGRYMLVTTLLCLSRWGVRGPRAVAPR